MLAIDTLRIDEVRHFDYDDDLRIIIHWSSNAGFGEYSLYYNSDDNIWIGDSESLDSGDDKKFLRALLSKIADSTIIRS